MSIFAYVSCVLLVATATTAADDEFGSNVTTATLAEVKNAVEQDYEDAKKIVDKVFLQMKLEIPLEMDSWPRMGKTPSATCFEFLKKGIETNRSLVANCSSPSLQGAEAIDIDRKKLEKVMNPLQLSIDEPKDVDEFCESWFYNIGVPAARTAMCKYVVHGGIPAMIARARVAINNIVGHVTDVANTWVTRASFFCLVQPGVGSRAEWSEACPKA